PIIAATGHAMTVNPQKKIDAWKGCGLRRIDTTWPMMPGTARPVLFVGPELLSLLRRSPEFIPVRHRRGLCHAMCGPSNHEAQRPRRRERPKPQILVPLAVIAASAAVPQHERRRFVLPPQRRFGRAHRRLYAVGDGHAQPRH